MKYNTLVPTPSSMVHFSFRQGEKPGTCKYAMSTALAGFEQCGWGSDAGVFSDGRRVVKMYDSKVPVSTPRLSYYNALEKMRCEPADGYPYPQFKIREVGEVGMELDFAMRSAPSIIAKLAKWGINLPKTLGYHPITVMGLQWFFVVQEFVEGDPVEVIHDDRMPVALSTSTCGPMIPSLFDEGIWIDLAKGENFRERAGAATYFDLCLPWPPSFSKIEGDLSLREGVGRLTADQFVELAWGR